MTGSTNDESLCVCIPVFNDWDSAIALLKEIDRASAEWGQRAHVLIVDDGSTDESPRCLPWNLDSLQGVEILRLRRNLGHQGAIAVGLSFIREQRPCDAVVVMDGDGEDRPQDIIKLVQRFHQGGENVVFAKRGRRCESMLFKCCYAIYQMVHLLLTGLRVDVGNFCILPARHLDRLTTAPELWNHFPNSILKAKIPVERVPLDRGQRIAGKSKMNFVALVTHGLSAISVFSEVVGVRLLMSSAGLIFLAAVALLLGLVFGTGTEASTAGAHMAFPGTRMILGGCLMIVLLQAATISLVFIFVSLQARKNLPFLPLKNYDVFVHDVRECQFEEYHDPMGCNSHQVLHSRSHSEEGVACRETAAPHPDHRGLLNDVTASSRITTGKS